MSSTTALSQSIEWVRAFSLGRPLTAFLNSEPALTSANIVLSTILGPPFTWNWNRNSVNFLTTMNVQDYAISVPTFGVIEKASKVPAARITNVVLNNNVATITANNYSVTSPTTPSFMVGCLVSISGLTTTDLNVTNAIITTVTTTSFSFALNHANISSTPDTGVAISGKTSEISNVKTVLGSGSEVGSPNVIAPQLDDNGGNITFRILPIPDQVYQINIVFQKRIPALMTSTSSTWAPIPDHYSYIYQPGFLALMMAYSQDPRWQIFNQKFVATLLGAAEGLDETQKNIFMSAWLNTVTEQQVVGNKAQQGIQGRGV